MSGGAVALFVALAGVIYWKGGASARGPVDAQPNASEQIEALRSELNEVKRNSAVSLVLAQAASQRSPTPIASSQVAPVASAPAPTAPEQTEEDKAEAARRVEIEQAESLDRKFAAEPIDNEWASRASEDATRALVSEVSGDTSIKRVDCRSTWCRIETFHNSLDSYRAFTQKSLLGHQRQLWDGDVTATVRDESESGVTAVTFITREGHHMPMPDGVQADASAARAPR